MSVEVIGPAVAGAGRPEYHPSAGGGAQREPSSGARWDYVPDPGDTGVGGAAGVRDVVPAEPPQGVDPELWSILTPDERAFLAKSWLLGPVTYGPGAVAPVWSHFHLGSRIDLRV